jgi:D-glycero-D-manno-heptose 1,7-bisphosphate phosphatase
MIEGNIHAPLTLFLDRDGVINKEQEGDYIRKISEFEFLPGVLDALKIANAIFDYIIVVTNQRGIGRGLMMEEDLFAIHDYMMKGITKSGGRIDKIYYASTPDKKHPYRKPNIGMGLHAKEDFPNIDFSNAYMIGNNLSDMYFGKGLKMQTILLHTTIPPQEMPNPIIDFQFATLYDAILFLKNSINK